MPVNLISEEDLRAALRSFRVAPESFEAGVRTRLEAAERLRVDDPLSSTSPFLRNITAYLPLALLAGCKVTPVATPVGRVGSIYKLLSYLTFPAISLFVLLGATILSVAKIRGIRAADGLELADQKAIDEATREWWKRNRTGATGVFAVTLLLALIGATWLLYLFYIVSFGILVYVLASFARLGIGNRQLIAQSSQMGLMFLASVASFSGVGIREIHFVDPMVIAAIFWSGWLALLPFVRGNLPFFGSTAQRTAKQGQSTGTVIAIPLIIGLICWTAHPLLWPATPSRIKHYVESFDKARFSTASWEHWEIPAHWVIDSQLSPDLTKPRDLIMQEVAGQQNPFILSTALRVGLLPVDQLDSLKDYQKQRKYLVEASPGLDPQMITSINQIDWVIRAAVLRNDLTSEERDHLEKRLHATLQHLLDTPYMTLSELLHTTQLLAVLDRPVDRDQYRDRVHGLLRTLHTRNTGGFQLAGGFKTYLTWPKNAWVTQPGSLESTACAVQLMEIYGVPDGVDLNWIRSFLKPTVLRFSDDKWMAASTLDRFNHLPGVRQPSWLEWLYYERSLLAAAVLVGLCLYATIRSPTQTSNDTAMATP